MPWIPRGLRDGIVTTGYPRRPDGYEPGFHGTVSVEAGSPRGDDGVLESVVAMCPTGAISAPGGYVRLDRGRCILCGRCTEAMPEVFRSDPDVETSELLRSALVVPPLPESDTAIEATRASLARRVKAFRRSIHIRHVDAGSDGSEEWEVAALTGPIYDVHRLGIFFTASPRHADLLLVTGAGSVGMRGPLRHTFEVMPDPKFVIAVGTDAISGGLLGGGYATSGGIDGTVPVDVFVPGSPPTPFGILHGILLGVGLLSDGKVSDGKAAS